MTQSMTGMGEGRIINDGFDVYVCIKTVNHRFFHFNAKLPRGFQNFDQPLREKLSQTIRRGKVDVSVEFYSLPETIQEVNLNRGLAEKLVQFSKHVALELHIPNDMTAEKILRYPDVLRQLPGSASSETIWAELERALSLACMQLKASREREGAMLVSELLSRKMRISDQIKNLRQLEEQQISEIRIRLNDLVSKLNSELELDDGRLEQEVLFHAVKADITEELTRMECHLVNFEKSLELSEAVGKRCEFLIQEMHREINTIGSKSVNKVISKIIIDIKVDIEKMREQVQNLE